MQKEWYQLRIGASRTSTPTGITIAPWSSRDRARGVAKDCTATFSNTRSPRRERGRVSLRPRPSHDFIVRPPAHQTRPLYSVASALAKEGGDLRGKPRFLPQAAFFASVSAAVGRNAKKHLPRDQPLQRVIPRGASHGGFLHHIRPSIAAGIKRR